MIHSKHDVTQKVASREQTRQYYNIPSTSNGISEREEVELARRLHKIKRRLLLNVANNNQSNAELDDKGLSSD